MGLVKKAAKGYLAVATGGLSIAAEKAINATSARGTNVNEEEAAAGALFVGMSHEAGRNAKITLYSDRIERVKERSRISVNKARQDTEVIPIKTVTSVGAKKDGVLFTYVTVYTSGKNEIDFRFRHEDAQAFKDAIMGLVLAPAEMATAASPEAAPDIAEQIKKLADLRDQRILSEHEFQLKKVELLAKM
jgi:hypothetical protein